MSTTSCSDCVLNRLRSVSSSVGAGALRFYQQLYHYRSAVDSSRLYAEYIYFPLLGPTAYLFFSSPLAKASAPRHALFGHAIVLLCGYGAFVLVGSNVPHGLQEVIHWQTGLAAALSLATTGALMVFFRISHPPAGATTLIVSLGLLWRPRDLLIIEAAVSCLRCKPC